MKYYSNILLTLLTIQILHLYTIFLYLLHHSNAEKTKAQYSTVKRALRKFQSKTTIVSCNLQVEVCQHTIYSSETSLGGLREITPAAMSPSQQQQQHHHHHLRARKKKTNQGNRLCHNRRQGQGVTGQPLRCHHSRPSEALG